MNITENLYKLRTELPPRVKLIAVSKNQTTETIREAYQAGQRLFGENKVQDLIRKYPLLPGDIDWHFIGHLQTNKVRYLVPFIRMIHSIDSIRLLKEVDKEAAKCARIIDCLLQFHIATEETKFGLNLNEACDLLESNDYQCFNNIRICGVMGMASFVDDEALVRQEMKALSGIFTHLKKHYFSDTGTFCEISLGMSGDYKIAVSEGSTMVRIGTTIFGTR